MPAAHSATPAAAPQDDLPIELIRELPLEALMQIEVTTVIGVRHEWFRSPSAVYVISGEEIRRTGHRSLAEALRLAPGVHVGRINASQWAVSARGFNSRFATKLLVLIDGRTVYDPLFSGTFWNEHDIMLEDIDRIEVIRGPGATLWGANAVNGVINVITRRADETQGLLITGGGGTFERAFGAVRYGGQLTDNAWFRVWTKYDRRANLQDTFGRSANDRWDMLRGGFRVDALTDVDTLLTLDGEVIHSDRIGEAVGVPVPGQHLTFDRVTADGGITGGHLLFRLAQDRRIAAGHEGWSLHAYYDGRDRQGAAGARFRRHTFDVEFRHHFVPLERHELMWGLGFRHYRDRLRPPPPGGAIVSFDPESRSINTVTAFIQDTMTLVPERLFFMVGSKFEHNDFTGFEVQPSARLWWTPDQRNTIWAAISRPVRVPSRASDDVRLVAAFADPGLLSPPGIPTGQNVPLTIVGNRSVKAERLLTYELGYRVQPHRAFSIDIAAFYNDYRDLTALPPTGFGTFNNDGRADTWGTEIAARWHMADNWRLEGAYSYLVMSVRGRGGAAVLDDPEHTSPRHMARLTSFLDITEQIEFNAGLYFVDRAPAQAAGSYTRLDLGLTWRPRPNVELAVWGQNLLQRRHREFNDALFLVAPVEMERSVYIQATLRY